MALLPNFVIFFRSASPLHALTRNVRWNVCNEIHAAHVQSTWRLAQAEIIIINRNNILQLQRFPVKERLFFFTYISRICLDSAAVWTIKRCHATTFPRFNSP